MATPLPLVQCCAPLGSAALSEDEAAELEQVFKALADRHRVKIVNRLIAAGGEAVCVCDFQDMLELKQSSVSYHLKQLLDAGIVEREKRGSFAYFSLAPGALEHVGSCSDSRQPWLRSAPAFLHPSARGSVYLDMEKPTAPTTPPPVTAAERPCCTPAQSTSCCEPSEKSRCCGGDPHPTRCGCR